VGLIVLIIDRFQMELGGVVFQRIENGRNVYILFFVPGIVVLMYLDDVYDKPHVRKGTRQ